MQYQVTVYVTVYAHGMPRKLYRGREIKRDRTNGIRYRLRLD